jgi:protoheme IX farnesyltransferase
VEDRVMSGHDGQAIAVAAPATVPVRQGGVLALAAALFKLRIGLAIAFSALAGALVAAGQWPAAGDTLLLLISVLMAAAGAGGCNHYFERDIDARMVRTRGRPFVAGRIEHAPRWLGLFAAMMLGGSLLAGLWLGWLTGMLVLAGALTYSVVYTLWLKRRTEWNIVIGGASGSFAVLAGASATGAWSDPAVLWLTAVLFLWTPSHFWALAIAIVEDYLRAGVPMLPVTRGRAAAARWSLLNTALLVLCSLAFAAAVAQPLVWVGALVGGGWMLATGWRMVRNPGAKTAMAAFRASLIQLGLLLIALFLAFGAA